MINLILHCGRPCSANTRHESSALDDSTSSHCDPSSCGDHTDLDSTSVVSSGDQDDDNFGDDEHTDTGRSSSERSFTDHDVKCVGNTDSMFKSPSCLSSSKNSLQSPSDLGTLQSGPSQPKLRKYGCMWL